MRYLAIFAILLVAACGVDTSKPSQTTVSTTPSQPSSFGAMLNGERKSRGIPAVRANARLRAAAQGHADDMSRRAFFSHTGSNGSSVGQRVRARGYNFCFVAENIAQGQRSEAEVFKSWMNSPGHRRNNLSRRATEFGLARAAGNYWVLVLGDPGC